MALGVNSAMKALSQGCHLSILQPSTAAGSNAAPLVAGSGSTSTYLRSGFPIAQNQRPKRSGRRVSHYSNPLCSKPAFRAPLNKGISSHSTSGSVVGGSRQSGRFQRRFQTQAAAAGAPKTSNGRPERDGSETASSSAGSWEIPDREDLEYKWLIEGGEKGPVRAADDDEEEVEWEEYEEEVEIEEGEEYEKVVYKEERQEAELKYPFNKADTVHMREWKRWPETWPNINALQEKVKAMFTVDEAKHVMKLSDPAVRKRYPITTNYDFDFRLAIMELFISLVRNEHGFAVCYLVPDGKKEIANNTEVGMSIAVKNVLIHPRTNQPYLEVMYQDHTFTKHLIDIGVASLEEVSGHYEGLLQECTPGRQSEPKQIICSERMFGRFRRLLQENEVLLGEMTSWQEARLTADWRPSFIQCFENVDFEKHQGLAEALKAQGLKPVKSGRDWYVAPLVPGDEGYDPKIAAKLMQHGPPGDGYKDWIGVNPKKVAPAEGAGGKKGPSFEPYEMPKSIKEIERSREVMNRETEDALRTAEAFAKKYGLPLSEAIEALAQLEEMESMTGDGDNR